MKKPKHCTGGVYVPWICGTCGRKQSCKPRNVSSEERYERKRVRA